MRSKAIVRSSDVLCIEEVGSEPCAASDVKLDSGLRGGIAMC